jgi:hypothetical protein
MTDDIKQEIQRLRDSTKSHLIRPPVDAILAVCAALEAADQDRAAAIAEAVSKQKRELEDDKGLLEDSIASAIAGSLARTGLTNEPHGTLEGYLRTLEKHIAEAVSQRTVECADVLVAAGYEGSMIHRAILDLNAPPAPAYPFSCKCWLLAKNGSWYRQEDFGTYTSTINPRFDAKHCEVCGAPRTKGD